MARGTSNSNSRGNSEDRRRRRAWILETFGIRTKTGKVTRIKCFHCPRVMRASGKWEVDRFPVCGHAGGRYTRDNIVPTCPSCNKTRCPLCAGVAAQQDPVPF